MNNKWAPYILIALMLIALIIIRTCRKDDVSSKPKVTHNNKPKDPAANTDRDRGFDRSTAYLEYSKHASCRMQCRKISQSEVEEIMQEGKINYNKSDLQTSRCPRYALEGETHDGQDVRIVFAQCNEKTVVVTVIDLGTDHACHCPGDDAQYNNKN
ncbi:MAG TPA: DUF4258 domain-containing protein [Chitinophagaceae bacterium]|nr:DUF4258 domain-containing protein [Chitinophagaceae bacterium]